jgi:fructose-1,6-bisphosphatase/inositol monophosphatase family enzyme
MPDYLEICERAVRRGGAVLLEKLGRVTAHEKGPADLVTEADLSSQEAIR